MEFTEVSDGIQIVGEVEGLTEGKHGFHVHAVGNIYPDCTAAKGHFNPENVSLKNNIQLSQNVFLFKLNI